MAKTCLLISLMVLLPVLMNGQSVSGKILDGSTHEPVAGATVVRYGFQEGTVTDSEGRFRLTLPGNGPHRLEVRFTGYFTENVRVTLPLQDSLIIRMQPAVVEMQQVVVTGPMQESRISDSPVKVQVLGRAMIDRHRTNNFMESLSLVSGIYTHMECAVCGTNSIRINGMKGPYTAVLIDGMPLMGALASVYGLNGIHPSMIDQIEIIKGPSGTLYGSEAMGGVVNIRTLSPEKAPRLKIDMSRDSHSSATVDVTGSRRMGKHAILAGTSFNRLSAFIDNNNDGFMDVTQGNRISFFSKYARGDDAFRPLQITGRFYYEDRLGGTEGYTHSIRGSETVYGESIYTRRFETSLVYRVPVRELVNVQLAGLLHNQDSYYGSYRYKGVQRVGFANLMWESSHKRAGAWLAGTTARVVHLEQVFSENPEFNGNEVRFIPGMYVQHEIKPGHTATILSGLRTDYDSDHGWIVSPRFNLKWVLPGMVSVRLNTGTGFRVVNVFTEEHDVLTGVRVIEVADGINPERSWNVTLNLNKIFLSDRAATVIDVDAYYTHFTNQIVPQYLIINGANTIRYENLAGYSYTRGISLHATQTFSFPFSMSAGFTFNETRLKHEGITSWMEFAPKYSAMYTLRYEMPATGLTLDLTGNVYGPMKLPEFEPPFERKAWSPWFSEHHVQVQYRLFRKTEVYLAVRNLFNYTQKNPLIAPDDPFGDDFDTSYVYGPIQARRFLFGLQISL